MLYRTFFKSYTEKVWGVPCHDISAEWGAQRVKGLSILKSLKHALAKMFGRGRPTWPKNRPKRRSSNASCIPSWGPARCGKLVAQEVIARGGRIITGAEVQRLHLDGDRITHVEVKDATTGQTTVYQRRLFLFDDADQGADRRPRRRRARNVKASRRRTCSIATSSSSACWSIELLVSRDTPQGKKLIDDNWIYIQEPDVLAGRLQIYQQLEPGDDRRSRQSLDRGRNTSATRPTRSGNSPTTKWPQLAIGELEKIGIIEPADVRDATVIRMQKTYPAYFGVYDRFDEIRQYIDQLKNLFLVGRNGMHKYNNQDHSMLTAMVAVDNIAAGRTDKANLWAVNTEQEYHEERTDQSSAHSAAGPKPAPTAGKRVAALRPRRRPPKLREVDETGRRYQDEMVGGLHPAINCPAAANGRSLWRFDCRILARHPSRIELNAPVQRRRAAPEEHLLRLGRMRVPARWRSGSSMARPSATVCSITTTTALSTTTRTSRPA